MITMAFKLTTTNASGVTDLTQLVQSVTWSGDYKQCARTLDFGPFAASRRQKHSGRAL